jgi:hypothetical protein
MCGLETLLACFSLSGFYVDGAISAHDRGEARVNVQTVLVERNVCLYKGFCVPANYNTDVVTVDDSAQNLYGRVAIGYDVTVNQVTLRLEASHESSIATGRDWGVNAINLGLTWRPFK